MKKDNLAIVWVHPGPSVLRKSFGAERKKTFGEALSRKRKNQKVTFRSIVQMHVLKNSQKNIDFRPVSYTHLTLPTILLV